MEEGLLTGAMVLVEARFLSVFALAVLEVEAWLRIKDGICERRTDDVAIMLPASW